MLHGQALCTMKQKFDGNESSFSKQGAKIVSESEPMAVQYAKRMKHA